MKNNGYTYVNHVGLKHQGKTVLDFYATEYPRFDRNVWARRLCEGQIRLNGCQAKADDILNASDRLTYFRPPWVEPDVPTDVQVLYEDVEMVVLNKPSGLPVMPGDVYLENTLMSLIKHRYGPDSSPIHRLDRDTSGVLLCAKTVAMRKRLGKLMQQNQIQKTYLALVKGVPLNERFECHEPIGLVGTPGTGFYAGVVKGGRASETQVRVCARDIVPGGTLVMAVLKTGRPHQIRIHLAAAGFPLMGDQFYGPGGYPNFRADFPGAGHFLLHARRMHLRHPVSHQRLSFTAPFPQGGLDEWIRTYQST